MVLSFILIQNRQCVPHGFPPGHLQPPKLTAHSTQGENTARKVVRTIRRMYGSPSCAFLTLPLQPPLIHSALQQDEEKVKLKGEVHRLVAPRDQKYQSNFVEFRNNKIVYRRYAGLFFCVCVDANDNELAYLEAIHFFVEVLDAFFGNVCELDLVFNFYKVRGARARPDGTKG